MIITVYAGIGPINDSPDNPAVNKITSTRDASSVIKRCHLLAVKQVAKQFPRLRRDKLAAYFMAREAPALQQQHPRAAANRSNRRRIPGRPPADHDQIKH